MLCCVVSNIQVFLYSSARRSTVTIILFSLQFECAGPCLAQQARWVRRKSISVVGMDDESFTQLELVDNDCFGSTSDVGAGLSGGGGESSAENADSNSDQEPVAQRSRPEIAESNRSDDEEIFFFDVNAVPVETVTSSTATALSLQREGRMEAEVKISGVRLWMSWSRTSPN